MVGAAAVAIALLRVRPARGRSLLRHWGGGRDASPDQAEFAARHLRSRRTAAVGFTAAGLVIALVATPGGPYAAFVETGLFVVLSSLLAGLLLAEWTATVRRQHGAVRSATLHRRSRRDLVPTYAVVLHAALTAVAVAVGVVLIVAPGWAERRVGEQPPVDPSGPRFTGEHAMPDLYRDLAAVSPTVGWLVIAAAVGAAALVFGVVRLAVTRPTAATDEWVDGALRMRSARVSTGIGIAFAAQLTGSGLVEVPLQLVTMSEVLPSTVDALTTIAFWTTFATFPLGIAAWSWVASPPHRRHRVGAT